MELFASPIRPSKHSVLLDDMSVSPPSPCLLSSAPGRSTRLILPLVAVFERQDELTCKGQAESAEVICMWLYFTFETYFDRQKL